MKITKTFIIISFLMMFLSSLSYGNSLPLSDIRSLDNRSLEAKKTIIQPNIPVLPNQQNTQILPNQQTLTDLRNYDQFRNIRSPRRIQHEIYWQVSVDGDTYYPGEVRWGITGTYRILIGR